MTRPLRAAPLLLALTACTALGGCTVGPNYHLPQNAAIQRPSAQGAWREGGEEVTAQPLPARWWHLFNDPELDRLEEQALAANTDLAAAGANLERAAAVTRATEGERTLNLDATFAAERSRLSGESFLLKDPLPVANLGAAALSLSYQVDLFGRIRRAVEAARAGQAASEATRDAVRVTLAADVARSYLALCSAHRAEDVATQSAELANRSLSISQRLLAAGKAPRTEVTLAEARAKAAEAAVPMHRARARAALYRLAYLLGRTPAEAPQEADACRTIPRVSKPLPTGDGAALLARRPDVRAAERELAAATAEIGVATAEMYPQITFGASGGSNGFLADLGQGAANTWGFGPLVHWNIPGAGARARLAATKAGAKVALDRFDSVVLGALRETETALSTYAEGEKRLDALRETRKAADEAAEQARRLREAGKAQLAVDISGRQSANAALAAEVAEEAESAQDQVSVFLALGGGW